MIHWPRVRQLRDEVGADEFDEVVEIFLDEVQEVIARLHADTARQDLEQNLHFLKGSALSLGFEVFSKLCQDGERLAVSGKATKVDLPEILAAFDASKLVFQAELKDNLH
ncbi:Hpt domain-containing protein [Ruegeria sp. R13_0]|uniref:Hpt domain-containing protein n=1 Tax=Ruegeria sp. R13_0 TaxID=2821099 RepID=UPI001ADD21A4|nr:Hpt domain-containing protein [Ruegeria sp. R13_0]MBO9434442.1 Hpt domain-containing protein [Ruegeria sp. R13_0]